MCLIFSGSLLFEEELPLCTHDMISLSYNHHPFYLFCFPNETMFVSLHVFLNYDPPPFWTGCGIPKLKSCVTQALCREDSCSMNQLSFRDETWRQIFLKIWLDVNYTHEWSQSPKHYFWQTLLWYSLAQIMLNIYRLMCHVGPAQSQLWPTDSAGL